MRGVGRSALGGRRLASGVVAVRRTRLGVRRGSGKQGIPRASPRERDDRIERASETRTAPWVGRRAGLRHEDAALVPGALGRRDGTTTASPRFGNDSRSFVEANSVPSGSCQNGRSQRRWSGSRSREGVASSPRHNFRDALSDRLRCGQPPSAGRCPSHRFRDGRQPVAHAAWRSGRGDGSCLNSGNRSCPASTEG